MPQTAKKTAIVQADVPTDALYKVYHMPAKLQDGYLESDLITDIIGFGRSSILEQQLVKNGNIFASIGAYIYGTVDPGLMVFSGKMEKGQTAENAEKALDEVIQAFLESNISDQTLNKVKNQAEAMKTYESVNFSAGVGLACNRIWSDADLYQTECEKKTQIHRANLDWAKYEEDNCGCCSIWGVRNSRFPGRCTKQVEPSTK